jgi:hypothetical protein
MKLLILASLLVMSCSYDVKSIKCYSDDKVIYESTNVYSLYSIGDGKYSIKEYENSGSITVNGNCIVKR